MSLNSLKIATDGYLKRGLKTTLIIAVAGCLNFTQVPPTPTPIKFKGASGQLTHLKEQTDVIERIKIEDEELVLFIKIFLKCQE